jgi:beta-1,4-N-acetylglucosaminyltransferase
MKRVMFISSTGGHLNELLMLKSIFSNYDYSLVTEYDKTTKDLGKKYHNVSYLVYGTKDHLFTYIFKFLWNIIKSIYLYIKYKPSVIVTTGTHTAVPMCFLGHWFGSKIIFIETFANSKTQTMSGKMIYPIADTFVVQWPEMKELYPNAEVWGWIY